MQRRQAHRRVASCRCASDPVDSTTYRSTGGTTHGPLVLGFGNLGERSIHAGIAAICATCSGSRARHRALLDDHRDAVTRGARVFWARRKFMRPVGAPVRKTIYAAVLALPLLAAAAVSRPLLAAARHGASHVQRRGPGDTEGGRVAGVAHRQHPAQLIAKIKCGRCVTVYTLAGEAPPWRCLWRRPVRSPVPLRLLEDITGNSRVAARIEVLLPLASTDSGCGAHPADRQAAGGRSPARAPTRGTGSSSAHDQPDRHPKRVSPLVISAALIGRAEPAESTAGIKPGGRDGGRALSSRHVGQGQAGRAGGRRGPGTASPEAQVAGEYAPQNGRAQQSAGRVKQRAHG